MWPGRVALALYVVSQYISEEVTCKLAEIWKITWDKELEDLGNSIQYKSPDQEPLKKQKCWQLQAETELRIQSQKLEIISRLRRLTILLPFYPHWGEAEWVRSAADLVWVGKEPPALHYHTPTMQSPVPPGGGSIPVT